MKRHLKILAICSLIVFGLSTVAFAGESIGFTVSCTIPAIPGVNAPLNEASTANPAELEEKEIQISAPDPKPQEEEPQFIEELEEVQLAQQESPVLTKVIYSR